MKPTIKEISRVRAALSEAVTNSRLSFADIARLAHVDPSQVSRICKGDFKTFSHNVVRICTVLKVAVPRAASVATDRELAKAQTSLRRIWGRAPERGRAIQRMLDSVAELQRVSDGKVTE